jgi:hypothetical protein
MPDNLKQDHLKTFYKMLDKTHANVVRGNKQISNSGRDWDILKFPKSKKSLPPADALSTISHTKSITPSIRAKPEFMRHQSPAVLNVENLEKVSSRNLSLSVMGHQKDVKENAYSQVSAKISYKEASAFSKRT